MKPKVICCVRDCEEEENHEAKSWPNLLQAKLDDEIYQIHNFAIVNSKKIPDGKTVMDLFDFQVAESSQPEIVLLMLGCYHSKTFNWEEDNYYEKYLELATALANLKSKPKVYLYVPPLVHKYGGF